MNTMPERFVENFCSENNFYFSSSFIDWLESKNVFNFFEKRIEYNYVDGEEGDTWHNEYYADKGFNIYIGRELNLGGDYFDYHYSGYFIYLMKEKIHQFIDEKFSKITC
jgi:hypothetical protein